MRLRKRCEKCGRTAMVRPRVRRCKHVAIPGGYACWGTLVAAPIVRPKDTSGRLEKKLAAAHAKLDDGIKAMRRTMTAITKAQQTIKRIERAIEQRDHPADGEPKKRRPRRGARKYAQLPDDVAAAYHGDIDGDSE